MAADCFPMSSYVTLCVVDSIAMLSGRREHCFVMSACRHSAIAFCSRLMVLISRSLSMSNEVTLFISLTLTPDMHDRALCILWRLFNMAHGLSSGLLRPLLYTFAMMRSSEIATTSSNSTWNDCQFYCKLIQM